MTRGLAWFTNDLRVAENAMLAQAAKSDALLCVYVVDLKQFRKGRYEASQSGYLRWAFLQETLNDLTQALQKLGQKLHVLYGEPSRVIPEVIQHFNIETVFASTPLGWDERQMWSRLVEQTDGVNFNSIDTYTLFDQDAIESLTLEWPMSFSKFRTKVKKLEVKLAPRLDAMPLALSERPITVSQPDNLPLPVKNDREFFGGTQSANEHWQAYASSHHIHRYKTTRNAIDDWQSSTKLSPWLNTGALSVRLVYLETMRIQQQSKTPSDVEWILVELLWREFFQWLGVNMGASMFRFKGLHKTKPLTTFYPDRFQKWCNGTTPWQLVNAIMKQLQKTGYISNRARQIAASALVNELSIDWRYGAAWFEHHLLDYDVNSNWGNWQYIAGVGVDPRGGRHFNLEKQRELFDPEGDYQRRWAPMAEVRPLDELDPTGWPIAYK